MGCTRRSYFRYFLISALDRSEVADHVGVGEHDSLGLGGGAGGENDFERVGRLNLHWTETLRRMACDRKRQIGGIDDWDLILMGGSRRGPSPITTSAWAETFHFFEYCGAFARAQHQASCAPAR